MTAWSPYRQASEKSVKVKGTGWQVDAIAERAPAGVDPKALDLDERLGRLDADGRLTLAADLRVSVDMLRGECGLDPDAPLLIYGAWRSEGALQQGAGDRIELQARATHQDVRLSMTLEGARLHGKVQLAIRVILGATRPRQPVTAWRAGSVLWEQVTTLDVGQAERFPTVLVPFAEGSQVRPAGALWSLDLDTSDLSLPAIGGLVMYVNADHPAAGLLRGEVRTAAARGLQAALKLDLARLLVRIALTHDEFLTSDRKWPAGSVGEVLTRNLKAAFPRTPIAVLAGQFKHEPAAIEARLQDRLGAYRTFAEAK